MKNVITGQDFELINPPYKDIAEMFNALSELYKNANDKTLIDEMVKIINNPILKVK
jgi:gamma-glutamylcysteine synthetase